jgi:hypothetical protein
MLGLAAGVAALAGVALCAELFAWRGFWKSAGQPIATFLAALVALSAAAIALYNGEEQRKADRARWQSQATLDREKFQRDRDDADRAHHREMVKDLRARFSDATNQLAHDSPTIRRSGAYAMAALADDWHNFGNDTERQTVVDVLCSYLTAPNPTFNEKELDPGADGPVRETICKLLSAHRSSDAKDSWVTVTLNADGADLRGLDLNFLNLTGMSLWSANLSGATLISAELSHICLYDSDLTNCDLSGANLRRALLNRSTLRGVRLLSCDLTDADIEETDLAGADLKGVHIERTNLLDADFREAKNLDQAGNFSGVLHSLERPRWNDAQRQWLRHIGAISD